jgi:hypothetical protein
MYSAPLLTVMAYAYRQNRGQRAYIARNIRVACTVNAYITRADRRAARAG